MTVSSVLHCCYALAAAGSPAVELSRPEALVEEGDMPPKVEGDERTKIEAEALAAQPFRPEAPVAEGDEQLKVEENKGLKAALLDADPESAALASEEEDRLGDLRSASEEEEDDELEELPQVTKRPSALAHRDRSDDEVPKNHFRRVSITLATGESVLPGQGIGEFIKPAPARKPEAVYWASLEEEPIEDLQSEARARNAVDTANAISSWVR